MTNKYNLNEKVQFANITHDEYDKPIVTRATLKVVRINESEVTPNRTWDYEVESISSGNRFYVVESEICSLVKESSIKVGTIVDKGRYVVARINPSGYCTLECNNYERFRDDYCMNCFPHISELQEATQKEIAEYRKQVADYQQAQYEQYKEKEETTVKMKNFTVFLNNECYGTIYSENEKDAIRSTMFIAGMTYAMNAKAIQEGKLDSTMFLDCSPDNIGIKFERSLEPIIGTKRFEPLLIWQIRHLKKQGLVTPVLFLNGKYQKKYDVLDHLYICVDGKNYNVLTRGTQGYEGVTVDFHDNKTHTWYSVTDLMDMEKQALDSLELEEVK